MVTSAKAMKRLLFAVVSTLLAIPASVQTAVVPSVGCGTNTAVAIKQFAPPSNSTTSGLQKIQTTLTIVDIDGKPLGGAAGSCHRSGRTQVCQLPAGLYAESEALEVPVIGIRNVLT